MSDRPEKAIAILCEHCGETLGYFIPGFDQELVDEINRCNQKIMDDIESYYEHAVTPPLFPIPQARITKASYKIHCFNCGNLSGPHFFNENGNYDPPDNKEILDVEFLPVSDVVNVKTGNIERTEGVNIIWLQ